MMTMEKDDRMRALRLAVQMVSTVHHTVHPPGAPPEPPPGVDYERLHSLAAEATEWDPYATLIAMAHVAAAALTNDPSAEHQVAWLRDCEMDFDLISMLGDES
jgi:hypothetical protein